MPAGPLEYNFPAMSPDTPSQKTQVCPTCGTRLAETAMRCPVCGTDLSGKARPASAQKQPPAARSLSAARMPEVTLSLPAALGLLVLFLAVGATVVYAGLSATQRVVNPTAIPTGTETAAPSPSPTDTQLPTLAPTATEQAPFEYTVASGDTCGGIAVTFGVSVQSVIILNNLPAACNNLTVGQKLKIPYPTATPLPLPTNTLQPVDATQAACQKVNLTVQENDTLSSIAANYAVSMQAIKDFNGLATDNVFLGQQLVIPLCARAATPGPTPTPTIPPPYPAANLLLPADGAAFTLAHDVVTLQWASIGALARQRAIPGHRRGCHGRAGAPHRRLRVRHQVHRANDLPAQGQHGSRTALVDHTHAADRRGRTGSARLVDSRCNERQARLHVGRSGSRCDTHALTVAHAPASSKPFS